MLLTKCGDFVHEEHKALSAGTGLSCAVWCAGESQAMGAAMFDFRSAPTSPSSAAFTFSPNVPLQGYQQQPNGVHLLLPTLVSLVSMLAIQPFAVCP